MTPAVVEWFYDGALAPARVAVAAAVAYAWLVALLRVSGKRTLSQLNAFDLVVTVALGSTLATIVLSDTVALVDGAVALATLVGLQLVVAFAQSRSGRAEALVKSPPTVLVWQGRLIRPALERQRVSEQEVVQALRSQGVARVEDADAVVLESNGRFTVLSAMSTRAALETGLGVPPGGDR
ncbi:MAG: DUF421 domain-containing protein [Thermoleophilia bacterium]